MRYLILAILVISFLIVGCGEDGDDDDELSAAEIVDTCQKVCDKIRICSDEAPLPGCVDLCVERGVDAPLRDCLLDCMDYISCYAWHDCACGC